MEKTKKKDNYVRGVARSGAGVVKYRETGMTTWEIPAGEMFDGVRAEEGGKRVKLSLLPEEKVFKDPVHDYIHVRKRLVWDLINTRAFQRLRRIKQMGTSDLTFHGAVHTRFAHSLGAYEVMRKLLNYLSRFWTHQPDEFVAVAYVAALLHDIGHGPFSHAFEKAIGSRHEEWTQRIIREDEEIAAILAGMDPGFPDEVARVYDEAQPVRFPLIRQLIASQLDVDRMDYLLRDAICTGVTYGRFELERMFRIMEPHWEGGGDIPTSIVLRPSGIHTVEQYLVARYFMFTQVYLHPNTIGSDVLLEKILRRARMLYREGRLAFVPRALVPFFRSNDPNRELSVSEYIALDETVMMAAFHEWQHEADPVLADLASRFLHRRLFQYVDFPGEEAMAHIRDALTREGLDPDSYLAVVRRDNKLFCDFSGVRVLVGGQPVDIVELSDIVRALRQQAKPIHKLYYPDDIPSVRDAVARWVARG
ncbi:HD domain-containing protein [Calditerricola yamamurae]